MSSTLHMVVAGHVVVVTTKLLTKPAITDNFHAVSAFNPFMHNVKNFFNIPGL